MREIKFRAWDKDNKVMWAITELNWRTPRQGSEIFYKRGVFGNNEQPLGANAEYVSMTSIILMQYTGLKDRNNKEIYEGDVVKATKSNPYAFGLEKYRGIDGKYEIIFCEGNFTIYKGLLMMEDTVNLMGLEIIGNIYENPELIKKEVQNETQ